MDPVEPFGTAQSDFLQVLLPWFRLRIAGGAAELDLRFDDRTPSIRSRAGKAFVRGRIDDFERRAADLQRELEAFLGSHDAAPKDFGDPAFPFRYASGGVLPVVRMGKTDYYCLFYRDVHPIGWNIANGGTDSLVELLDPRLAIERELREELIIIDLSLGVRYVFETEGEPSIDHPDLAVALRKWASRFLEFRPSFKPEPVAQKWLQGRDTLRVEYEADTGTTHATTIGSCFLNVNALDFGIEIDRIAKLNVGDGAIFCDGELLETSLLNQVIGLFAVEQVNRTVDSGGTEFRPTFVYHDARRYDADRLEDRIARYLRDLGGRRRPHEIEAHQHAARPYDLCPVTRRIIGCYKSYPRPEPVTCDMFLSFAKEDVALAHQVYETLSRVTGRSVFFSERSIQHADFARAIDEALDQARCLIAVGSQPELLAKPYVAYECRSFHLDVMRQRKPAQIYSVVDGIDHAYLPLPLRTYESMDVRKAGLEQTLHALANRVG